MWATSYGINGGYRIVEVPLLIAEKRTFFKIYLMRNLWLTLADFSESDMNWQIRRFGDYLKPAEIEIIAQQSPESLNRCNSWVSR